MAAAAAAAAVFLLVATMDGILMGDAQNDGLLCEFGICWWVANRIGWHVLTSGFYSPG